MKKINLIIVLLAALLIPAGVLALNKPTIDSVPSSVDADVYTLTIHAAVGSKITVVGGPAFLPPVTDGAGSDELDGTVEIMVGLAQNEANVFSIVAEKGGEISDSAQVTINESSQASGPQTPGDHTPPEAPTLDAVNNPVEAYEYTITGSTEANANIYVKRPDGSTANTTAANGNGIFEVTVDLEVGKTNRFNVSAEDAAYNIGPSSQIVIQAIAPEMSEMEPGEVVTDDSSDEFFPDVPDYHQNRVAIKYLKDQDFIQGYPDGTFQPSREVNRAEFTKIIVGAKLGKTPSISYATDCFPDVKGSDWYASYVCYAKDQGIISGYPDGEFKPGNTINLAEASKILVNTLNVEKTDPAGTQWYSEFLESLSKLNYLPTSFRSLSQNVNRGEMSEMIWRITEQVQDKGSVSVSELQ